MFRYDIRFRFENNNEFVKKVMNVTAYDKNSDMKYQTVIFIDDGKIDMHILGEMLTSCVRDLLNKIAKDTPNLHYERDLHRDCVKMRM